MLEQVAAEARTALEELLAAAKLRPGQVLVLGASSSEICGERIGTHSSAETAQAVLGTLLPALQAEGIFLAVQCCEHLNRALVVEEDAARQYGWTVVNAVPQPHAGGAFAANAYRMFASPVVVEQLQAHAGMDIGQTLIGMHLRPVAVPVRTSVRQIGKAVLTLCRTRPKFVGGSRAQYDERLL